MLAAERLAAGRVRPVDGATPTGLRADVEALRWFDLPAGCLASEAAATLPE